MPLIKSWIMNFEIKWKFTWENLEGLTELQCVPIDLTLTPNRRNSDNTVTFTKSSQAVRPRAVNLVIASHLWHEALRQSYWIIDKFKLKNHSIYAVCGAGHNILFIQRREECNASDWGYNEENGDKYPPYFDGDCSDKFPGFLHISDNKGNNTYNIMTCYETVKSGENDLYFNIWNILCCILLCVY